MRLLSRLSLAQQVMLIVAAGLILAQTLNFAILLNERRGFGLENAAVPAVSRVIDALDAGDEALPARRRGPPRARVWTSPASPVAADAARLASVENLLLAQANEEARSRIREVRAALQPGRRGPVVVVSARLENGMWLSASARGPEALGPAILALGLQTLVILGVLLLPLLLLVRSATRPLAALAEDAETWTADDPSRDARPSPTPAAGPRDVRELVRAVEEMKGRIVAMLRERDVMLGAIGHDLRTPLAALRIQVELVEDEQQKHGMVQEIDRLSGDLENILSLARGSAHITREPNDLVQIASEVTAQFRARGADVVLAPHEAVIAPVDAAALRRAIANLVDNAVRYGEAAALRLDAGDGTVTIIVEDAGPGIAETALGSAAEPFVRLEPSRNRATGGHGLGLAIVAAIARAHGGGLHLANRPEGGLRAELWVPADLLTGPSGRADAA